MYVCMYVCVYILVGHHQQVYCHLGQHCCGDREPNEILRAQHRYSISCYGCGYVCMYVYNMSTRLSRSVIGLLGCFELVVLHLRHPFVLWKYGTYTATKHPMMVIYSFITDEKLSVGGSLRSSDWCGY